MSLNALPAGSKRSRDAEFLPQPAYASRSFNPFDRAAATMDPTLAASALAAPAEAAASRGLAGRTVEALAGLTVADAASISSPTLLLSLQASAPASQVELTGAVAHSLIPSLNAATASLSRDSGRSVSVERGLEPWLMPFTHHHLYAVGVAAGGTAAVSDARARAAAVSALVSDALADAAAGSDARSGASVRGFETLARLPSPYQSSAFAAAAGGVLASTASSDPRWIPALAGQPFVVTRGDILPEISATTFSNKRIRHIATLAREYLHTHTRLCVAAPFHGEELQHTPASALQLSPKTTQLFTRGSFGERKLLSSANLLQMLPESEGLLSWLRSTGLKLSQESDGSSEHLALNHAYGLIVYYYQLMAYSKEPKGIVIEAVEAEKPLVTHFVDQVPAGAAWHCYRSTPLTHIKDDSEKLRYSQLILFYTELQGCKSPAEMADLVKRKGLLIVQLMLEGINLDTIFMHLARCETAEKFAEELKKAILEPKQVIKSDCLLSALGNLSYVAHWTKIQHEWRVREIREPLALKGLSAVLGSDGKAVDTTMKKFLETVSGELTQLKDISHRVLVALDSFDALKRDCFNSDETGLRSCSNWSKAARQLAKTLALCKEHTLVEKSEDIQFALEGFSSQLLIVAEKVEQHESKVQAHCRTKHDAEYKPKREHLHHLLGELHALDQSIASESASIEKTKAEKQRRIMKRESLQGQIASATVIGSDLAALTLIMPTTSGPVSITFAQAKGYIEAWEADLKQMEMKLARHADQLSKREAKLLERDLLRAEIEALGKKHRAEYAQLLTPGLLHELEYFSNYRDLFVLQSCLKGMRNSLSKQLDGVEIAKSVLSDPRFSGDSDVREKEIVLLLSSRVQYQEAQAARS